MSITQTDKEWIDWSERNPYFGVLGVETGDISKEEIMKKVFDSGVDHVSMISRTIEEIFGPLRPDARILDFGCGVGRLVAAFARQFGQVVGVDISPAVLKLAA